MLRVLSTAVFACAVMAKPLGTGGSVLSVSDSFNYQDALGGNSKAPSWFGMVEFTAARKSGVFTASSSGAMVFENAFSSTNTISGDTLTVTFSSNSVGIRVID